MRFRHQDDAIKVRSNKKLFKDAPNIYLKYGKDEKSVSIAPNIDDDLADLANLAGRFFSHFYPQKFQVRSRSPLQIRKQPQQNR